MSTEQKTAVEPRIEDLLHGDHVNVVAEALAAMHPADQARSVSNPLMCYTVSR